MDLIVSAEDGVLSYHGRRYPCALGRSGITNQKIEGDGATPLGCFPLREIWFRGDRLDAPRTGLPLRPIRPEDGWCDAPDDPAYNRPVTLPYAASAEALWRDDAVYDVVVALGYNDDPPVAGKGSAIFLHVAREDYSPTEGCVAVALPDLLAVLQTCSPGDRLCVTRR